MIKNCLWLYDALNNDDLNLKNLISDTNTDWSQEFAVLHDHEAVDTLTNMMNWIYVLIWFQDHVSIWQSRSKTWHTDTTITRFACEFLWWMNCKSITNSAVIWMIWENMTCFHWSQTWQRQIWNWQMKYESWWIDELWIHTWFMNNENYEHNQDKITDNIKILYWLNVNYKIIIFITAITW